MYFMVISLTRVRPSRMLCLCDDVRPGGISTAGWKNFAPSCPDWSALRVPDAAPTPSPGAWAKERCKPALFQLGAGLAHDTFPLDRVRLDQGGEFARRHDQRIDEVRI